MLPFMLFIMFVITMYSYFVGVMLEQYRSIQCMSLLCCCVVEVIM